jgi:hypothetical protein
MKGVSVPAAIYVRLFTVTGHCVHARSRMRAIKERHRLHRHLGTWCAAMAEGKREKGVAVAVIIVGCCLRSCTVTYRFT